MLISGLKRRWGLISVPLIMCCLLLPIDGLAFNNAPASWWRAFCEDNSTPIPPAATCEELFQNAPEFLLCEQTETTCAFNARTNGGTCTEMCQRFGSVCLEAQGNENATPCTPEFPQVDTCDTPRGTEICVCERLDTVPPPPAQQTCQERYGSVREFILCSQTEDSCSFNARTDGGSCNDVCRSFGSACLGARGNENSAPCTPLSGPDTCESTQGTEICICER